MRHQISQILPLRTGHQPQTSMPAGFRGHSACLTDAFASNAHFLSALMPSSRYAVTHLNKTIRGIRSVPPSATTKNEHLYSRVALAVDRGVLYLYGVDVGGPAAIRLKRGGSLARSISKACEAYQPPRQAILHSRSAIGWFYFLGLREPVFRGFVQLGELDLPSPPSRPTSQSSTKWFESLIPDDVSHEIAAMLRAVRDSRLPGQFRANPVFGALGAVRGSDGDWLSGDTLVELKCTVGGIKREHVAQLLCYYAFDQLGVHGRLKAFGFSRLALCLPRHTCVVEGSVEDWLVAFGGPDVSSLPAFVRTRCTNRCN